jgi:hypothetical protein
MSEQQYERVKHRPLHKLYAEGARREPLVAAWWRVFGVHSCDWKYDREGEHKVEMIGKDEFYGVYTILLFHRPLTLDEVNVRCVCRCLLCRLLCQLVGVFVGMMCHFVMLFGIMCCCTAVCDVCRLPTCHFRLRTTL